MSAARAAALSAFKKPCQELHLYSSGLQVEGGAVLRALWRWSCLQLAERVGAGAEQAGGGLHEAAIYAALSGHLARSVFGCFTETGRRD